MTRSTFHASFLLLPPATSVLLLSAAFRLTSGHALPRQTRTVELHELNVVPFPPAPTEAPVLFPQLLRRQGQNTVCGYIGGNPNLPATCLAGSHCVLEQDHGVVGCCPDGGTCSTGIFTGCVDRNSEPQTEINPYVFTCQGSDVCYRNQFAGGYFQFGCGTASNLGTTVETSVDGMTSLVFEETSMPLTASPNPLTEPTSIGSLPSSESNDPGDASPSTASSTESNAASSASSALLTSSASPSETSLPPTLTSSQISPNPSSSLLSSSSLSSSSTSAIILPSTTKSPGTPTDSSTPDGTPSESATDSSTPAPVSGSGTTNRGAIIGGSISGAIVLIALLIAAILLYLRRRRGNKREGPGPLPSAPPKTEYISPMRSHGAAFAPLPSWQDDEDVLPLTHSNNYNNSSRSQPYISPEPWQPGVAVAKKATTTGRGFSQPLRYHPTVAPVGGLVGTGLTPVAEEEQPASPPPPPQQQKEHHDHGEEPHSTSEIDDFSRAYSRAGIGTQELEEDMQPLTRANPDENLPPGSVSGVSSPSGSLSPSRGPGAGGSGNRPLWQQNRQQGRNLMWI